MSANPTGPLTAASGRHAAFGDALSRLLEFAGHHVEREFYVNDAGSQVAKLGASIRARARGEEVPEDGYQGDYVAELAEQIPGAADKDPDELARLGVELMLERNRATMETYRVHFDRWFSERTLYDGDPTPVERAYEQLEAQGHLYRSEGALWLRTTDTGDDKDRVLRALERRADVLRLRHRLPRGQARARPRPAHRRPRAPTTTATSGG